MKNKGLIRNWLKTPKDDRYALLGVVPEGKKPKQGECGGRCLEDCRFNYDTKCKHPNRMVNIVGMCLSWD